MGWMDENGKSSNNGGGKYLRATLALMACESICGDFSPALPVAAAIELIHNYSLVHDDIQDDDEFRRHKPTVWKIWGKPQAINVGSAMKTIANNSVFALSGSDIPLIRLIEILKVINGGCLQMIEGQYLDISFEGKKKIKVEDYLEMVHRKTAALIESSLQIGALLFLDPDKVEPFKKFGNLLGMAFQIEDDILGIWGNDSQTGKPSGNDIKKKKKSLPIVYFLNNSSHDKRELFEEIYKSEYITENDFNRIMEFLNESDTREFCNKTAQSYHKAAMDELEKLPVKNGWIVQFKEVAEFLLKRDF